jgi:polyphenol oxidase
MSAPFVASDLVPGSGIRHGFFGRQGGVSTGPFASLNVSTASGDDLNHVAHNRGQAAETLGFSSSTLVTVAQVHGTDVVTVTAASPASQRRPEADALVTDVRGLALGILTADCAPVLLADPVAGVVGAFHAGWKGAMAGVALRTVEAMVRRGAVPDRIVAAIGPTISAANYEVGAEFAANLLAQHDNAAHRIITPSGGIAHFDLPGFVADQLRAAGLEQVDQLDICTYAEPDRYFSHRHATHHGTTTGRQIALIGLA